MLVKNQYLACDHMVTFDSKAAKIEGAMLLT
jgi:hypothetical protein